MKLMSKNLAVLVGAGLLAATSSQAQDVQVRSENADRARVNMEKSVKAAARGQKVGMVTGQANPQARRLANGTVVQELDAGTMSYTVARRNADGSLEMICVESAEAAEKVMNAPVFAKRPSTVAKEQSNVR